MKQLVYRRSVGIFLCLVFLSIFSNSLFAGEIMKEKLERAFFAAFSDQEQFKSSQVFQLLEYKQSEIDSLGNVTPRPASITVEFEMDEVPGFFKTIRVLCREIKYYKLTISSAVFEFPNCKLNMDELEQGKVRFEKLPNLKIETNVSEQDILKVFDLYARSRNLQDLKLSLDKKRITLRGYYKKGFLTVYFKVFGKTRLVSPKVIDFRCNRLTLNGIPIPRSSIGSIFSKINPVFDATKTWLNLSIDKVVVGNGLVKSFSRIDTRKNN